MIGAYLSDRSIAVEDGNVFEYSCGVPQGSLLASTLWNILYDRVLRTHIGEDVPLFIYTDDLAIIILFSQQSMF